MVVSSTGSQFYRLNMLDEGQLRANVDGMASTTVPHPPPTNTGIQIQISPGGRVVAIIRVPAALLPRTWSLAAMTCKRFFVTAGDKFSRCIRRKGFQSLPLKPPQP